MAPHTTEACDWLICVVNQGLAFLYRSALAVGGLRKENSVGL